jgi:hypothetical protein
LGCFARAYEFSCEYSGLLSSLLGLGGIPLRPARGLDYEGFGLVLDNFELGNITIELAGILAYKLIAFPDLDPCWFSFMQGYAGREGLTCACGSGFQNTALRDSMMIV